MLVECINEGAEMSVYCSALDGDFPQGLPGPEDPTAPQAEGLQCAHTPAPPGTGAGTCEGHCPAGSVHGFQLQSSIFHISRLLCASKQLVLFVLGDFLIY